MRKTRGKSRKNRDFNTPIIAHKHRALFTVYLSSPMQQSCNYCQKIAEFKFSSLDVSLIVCATKKQLQTRIHNSLPGMRHNGSDYN